MMEKENNKYMYLEISNLGTINGIKKLIDIMGSDYFYPRINFYALDFGMFSPEDSHFVLYSTKIKFENKKITFVNEKRTVEIQFVNPLENIYFNGNKIGYTNFENRKIRFIEFTTEDYYLEIGFDEKNN